MSRKHFFLIAQAIRKNIPDRELDQILPESLIMGLASRNPNFSASRFQDAEVGERLLPLFFSCHSALKDEPILESAHIL